MTAAATAATTTEAARAEATTVAPAAAETTTAAAPTAPWRSAPTTATLAAAGDDATDDPAEDLPEHVGGATPGRLSPAGSAALVPIGEVVLGELVRLASKRLGAPRLFERLRGIGRGQTGGHRQVSLGLREARAGGLADAASAGRDEGGRPVDLDGRGPERGIGRRHEPVGGRGRIVGRDEQFVGEAVGLGREAGRLDRIEGTGVGGAACGGIVPSQLLRDAA